jgi:Zn-dependent protease
MSWSIKIGRVFGIPIYLHWTFIILMVWLAVEQMMEGASAAQAIQGLAFPLSLFGCVVLHELGHAVAAQRYGVPTRDITLLPIGGVARLERMPEKPSEELVVALAGPLVNVVIALGLYALGTRVLFHSDDTKMLVHGGFASRLLLVNVFLVLFNLIPAFPMDGGRVLRALLAMTMDYGRATRIAAGVGQFLAILFLFIGLQHNPFLILIALFVWIGAQSEATQVTERLELAGSSVRDAMLTDFAMLSPTDSLGHAVERLLAGSQHDFPVFDGRQFTGVLSRTDLLRGLSQEGRDAPIAPHVQPGLEPVELGAPLMPALNRLRETGIPCVPVVDRGEPVGLLHLDNIAELLMVKAALGARGPRAAPGAKSNGLMLG